MASHILTIDTPNSSNNDGESLSGVSATSLYTALVRAKESSLPEDKRRFNDPYAAKLAKPMMEKLMEAKMKMAEDKDRLAVMRSMFKYIIDRTVYFDIAIQQYLVQHPQCKQIVILGSGMDTRAYRMGLSADMKIFEIDYAHVHDYKTAVLKDDKPSCQRIVVKADMAKDDWAVLLTSAHNDNLGTKHSVMFDVTQATFWLAEGFMAYIPETAVAPFISCVNALSANESAFVFDGFRSRDRFSDISDESSVNFMASLVGDSLDALNKLGWQIYHTSDQSEVNSEFYTLLKQ